jgi:hypothetical protein
MRDPVFTQTMQIGIVVREPFGLGRRNIRMGWLSSECIHRSLPLKRIRTMCGER